MRDTVRDELPRSLQSMIADAKNAVDEWPPEEDGDDPGLRAARDWLIRLSRGEYDDREYWECAAEDCEDTGNWLGAIAAYRKIGEVPDLYSMYRAKAHRSIGMVQALLGQDRAALKSYRTAVSCVRDDVPVLQRTFIGDEIAQLSHMGRIRTARKLIERGLASHNDQTPDHLGMAMLLVRLSQCDLADRKLIEARQSLDCAAAWLDVLLQSFRDVMDDEKLFPKGVVSAVAVRWFWEGRRRRLANEEDTEIEALEQAVREARRCFDPHGWQHVWDDLRLMYMLDELAVSHSRHGRKAEAAAARAEVDEIIERRHFPKSAIERERRAAKRTSSFMGKLSSWFRLA